MEKAMEKLAKMNLTEEHQKKLAALLAEGKKAGKVTSKRLIETLDALDASEELTEQIYDLLEQNSIEIDVGDVLDILTSSPDITLDGLEELPTETELQSLEEAPLATPAEAVEDLSYEGAKLDDPVRMYLKEIG